ncbi:two-component system KDP operon response regulator KdpE [Streptomyces sp. HB372]|nr:two-component system KDP operon response regulator KdpE [Streptomyces sp. HB372]
MELLQDTGHRWGTEPPHPTGVRLAHNQGESAQPMPRVLVVEDDVQLVRALKINLQARSYEVEEASDAGSALRLAATCKPDVIVLDLGLPDMDGVELIRMIRGWSRVPILVLSARHMSEDKVRALDAGADDYVTKPFSMDELLARLRAATRRRQATADTPELTVVTTDGFTIDLAAKKVQRDSGTVRLTPTEWHLLEVLVTSPGRLVSQRALLREVWGPTYAENTNYLRVYMAQLRRKLEADPAHPRYLITEPGMGYRFEP